MPEAPQNLLKPQLAIVKLDTKSSFLTIVHFMKKKIGGSTNVKMNDVSRHCTVCGEKAVFHGWFEKSWVVPPSPLMGGHPGGTVGGVFGIVEYDDGKIGEVLPSDISFGPDNSDSIFNLAINTFGREKQQLMVIEEMAELTKEISKNQRGRENVAELAEEIADVSIMLRQLILMFDCDAEVERVKMEKIKRLEKRIAEVWKGGA